MERSNDVIVVFGDFGWNDVGFWDFLGVIYLIDDEGNIKRGENIIIDIKNLIIYLDDKLILIIGISDLIVVFINDVVMVCRKDKV